MSKERPILFSGAMVRAILSGTKTQTRRVVQIDDSPISRRDYEQCKRQRGIPTNAQNVRFLGPYLKCDAPRGSATVSSRVPCPYGASNDRLWVRESFTLCESRREDGNPSPLYRATSIVHDSCGLKWKPSIHMPRWASRINLGIIFIRAQRLQEISEADAIAEGIDRKRCCEAGMLYRAFRGDEWQDDPIIAFRALWDSINAERGYGWEKNPWVWVIEFCKL